MTFFYDLNKRMATLADKQDADQLAESKQANHVAQSPLTQALNEAKADTIYVQHSNGAPQKVKLTPDMKAAGKIYVQHPSGPQTKVKIPADAKKSVKEEDVAEADYSAKKAAAGKDIGKPGKNFSKIAKGAAERYGSKAAGERVAGAVLNKLRHPKESTCMADEGNAFTGKLASTPKGGKFKLGDKEFKDTSDLEEGFKEMDAWLASREKEKGTGKFDKKERTLPGGMKATTYTRKHEDDEDKDDDKETSSEPKRRGRPKGKDKGPERVTAKAWKHKGDRKSKVKEDDISITDRGEYDDEAGMAKDSLHTIVRSAKELESALRSNENLPEWVQEKIGQIKGMMSSVTDYIISTHERDVEQHTGAEGVTMEKAPPGAKAERMVKGIKKSLSKDGKLSDKDKAIAYATTWKAKKAGKVEEEGAKPDFLDMDKDGDKKEPMKKAVKDKEEKVDETSDAPKKSKGGYNFGGGVYESFNNQVEGMITEGMSINVSVDEQGKKSISVNATDDDAEALAQLLKMAGLESQSTDTCPSCGESPCCCEEELDENSPDWPTNTETSDDAFQYSGGLNGPKSTGQTTIPVIASQLRRQVSMEENVELERSLFKLYKDISGK